MLATPQRTTATVTVRVSTTEEFRDGEATRRDVRRLLLSRAHAVRAARRRALRHLPAERPRGAAAAEPAALRLPRGPHPRDLGVPHRPGAGGAARPLDRGWLLGRRAGLPALGAARDPVGARRVGHA